MGRNMNWKRQRNARNKSVGAVSILTMLLCSACLSCGGIKPPSAHYARALINDCDPFAVRNGSARHVVEVTGIGQNLDSGGNTWVKFSWRWIAGENAKDQSLHESDSTFLYSDKNQQWYVERIHLPDKEEIDDVCDEPSTLSQGG
jgi:hypothetical protein